jgi:hypothetical protein
MKCTHHPDVETELQCAGCDRPFCSDCVIPLERLSICADCKGRFLGDEGPRSVAPAPRPRRPAHRAGWTPWVIGSASLLAAALFAFVVIGRLASPVLAERRAARLADALDELARIGTALEAHRLDHGAWPDSLAELVPAYLAEVPRDPFGRKPPVYVHEKDHTLLYSIGPDGNDDAGAPLDETTGRGDLLYIVE